MSGHAFICHASVNSDVADSICTVLESAGAKRWIAPRDILPGTPYGEAILHAISGAAVIIVVFSTAANESPHVLREVERAVNRNIPILLFRIEDVLPSNSMEYFVSTHHWLDGANRPLAEGKSLLLDAVQKILQAQDDAEVASPARALDTGMPDHGELAGAHRDHIAEEVPVTPVREVGCASSECPETIERIASIALLRPGRQADLDELVAALSDPDPQIRGAAITALTTAPPESSQIAREALIAGLTFERHVPAGPFSSGVNDDPDDELGYLPGGREDSRGHRTCAYAAGGGVLYRLSSRDQRGLLGLPCPKS